MNDEDLLSDVTDSVGLTNDKSSTPAAAVVEVLAADFVSLLPEANICEASLLILLAWNRNEGSSCNNNDSSRS
jgi:hypothetical protein